jgi:hypothetical protein
MTYTGQDGKHGAVKDPIDCARYLALAGASYVNAAHLECQPLGSY